MIGCLVERENTIGQSSHGQRCPKGKGVLGRDNKRSDGKRISPRGKATPPTTNMKSETAADLIISDKNFQEIVNYGYGLWRGEKRKRREESGEGSVCVR